MTKDYNEFLYDYNGDKMIVYIDLVLLLNIALDSILLMSVSVLLGRNVTIKRIIIGSLFGSISTLILFLSITSLQLLILKFLLGILMCIVTFGYINFKYTLNNVFYLYIISFIIGGGLTLIKDYGYYNYIVLIIGFIVISYLFIKQTKKIQDNYSNYFKVDIYIKGIIYKLNGYLDTGNKLFDQYKHRPIILVSENIKYDDEDIIYVPYVSLNNESLVKCLKTEKVVINNKVFNNYLVGLSDKKFHIDGINCILHSKMKGNL